jgi:hypothetical protein
MKKLLLSVLIVMTFNAYSQNPVTITSIKFCSYNVGTDDYDCYKTAYPKQTTYMILSTELHLVTIGGETPHTFQIDELIRDTYTAQSFECTNFSGRDEEGRDIGISICVSKSLQSGFMIILYPHNYSITYNF